MTPSSLREIKDRLEACTGPENALDIAIDIALFEPDRKHVSVRANAAGTKLVYARHDGKTDTYWAQDHTLNEVRRSAARALIAALITESENAR